MAEAKFETWGVVEVMGHQRYAGFISEQVFGGASFVRIDVPAAGEGREAFTKLFGAGSIYAITPTSEAVARDVARQCVHRPVTIYAPSVQSRLEFDEHGVEDEY